MSEMLKANYLNCKKCREIKSNKLIALLNKKLPNHIAQKILSYFHHCAYCKKLNSLIYKQPQNEIHQSIYIIINLYKNFPDREKVRDGCEFFVYGYKGTMPMLNFKRDKFYNDRVYEISKEIYLNYFCPDLLLKHKKFLFNRLQYFGMNNFQLTQLIQDIVNHLFGNSKYFYKIDFFKDNNCINLENVWRVSDFIKNYKLQDIIIKAKWYIGRCVYNCWIKEDFEDDE